MVVRDYMHGACRIIVNDDYYTGRTKEQQKEDLETAKKVARQIVLARERRKVTPNVYGHAD